MVAARLADRGSGCVGKAVRPNAIRSPGAPDRSRLEAAPEAINWKLGLVRMWLLLSVLWAAFWPP